MSASSGSRAEGARAEQTHRQGLGQLCSVVVQDDGIDVLEWHICKPILNEHSPGSEQIHSICKSHLRRRKTLCNSKAMQQQQMPPESRWTSRPLNHFVSSNKALCSQTAKGLRVLSESSNQAKEDTSVVVPTTASCAALQHLLIWYLRMSFCWTPVCRHLAVFVSRRLRTEDLASSLGTQPTRVQRSRCSSHLLLFSCEKNFRLIQSDQTQCQQQVLDNSLSARPCKSFAWEG